MLGNIYIKWTVIAIITIRLLFFSVILYSAEFELGLSVSRQVLLAELSGSNTGNMEDDMSVFPVIGLLTSKYYFGDNNWGYLFGLMAGPFDISKQEVGGEQVDLGTRMKGYYAYATPVIFYQFGDKKNRESWRTSIGLGFGVGYLKVKGDMIMTEVDMFTKQEFNDSGFGISGAFYLGVSNTDWFFRITNFVSTAEIDGYELALPNVQMIVGKKFEF